MQLPYLKKNSQMTYFDFVVTEMKFRKVYETLLYYLCILKFFKATKIHESTLVKRFVVFYI